MKRFAKIAIVLLSLVLVLAACGGGSSNSGGSTSNTGGGSSNTGQSGGSSGGSSGNNQQLTELEVVLFADGTTVKDLALVQDAVNEYIKDLVNMKVNFTMISPGDYVQKTNLLLSGNEKLDLMIVSPFFGYHNQVARGQLQPLDDLIEQYGPDIKRVLGDDFLGASKVNGKIYGIVPMKDMAAGTGLVMRKDLVDKYNIDISSIKSLWDITPILKVIKDNEPDVTPIVPSSNAPLLYHDKWYDDLGDGLGVLPYYDNDMKVVNLYETPEYAERLKLMREWYNAGYISKDAATTKEVHLDLVKAGKAFSYFSPTKVGQHLQESNSTGREMVVAEYRTPSSTTSTVISFMWAVPLNAKTPEKSIEFLNLLYKDKHLINLLSWGIEGTHYIKVADNIIKYPDGLNGGNHPYNVTTRWQFGDTFQAYTLEGADPEINVKMDQFNKSAAKSKALGFSFDNSAVKTEVAAVTNVIDQYRSALEAGMLDPEEKLPEFISKLKDAGIDKIIEEKQRQLDEWSKLN